MLDFVITTLLLNTVALFGLPALSVAAPGSVFTYLGITAVIIEPILVVWLFLLRRSAKMYQKGLDDRFAQRKRASYYEKVASQLQPAERLQPLPTRRSPAPRPALTLLPPGHRTLVLPPATSMSLLAVPVPLTLPGRRVRYAGKTYEERGGGAWLCLEDQEYLQADGTSYREVAGL